MLRSCLSLTKISHSGADELHSDKASRQPRLGEAPSCRPPRPSPEIAAWCGGDISIGSFISKRGTSLADLHACLQMKSIATAAQSEAGTALHAGLPGPVMDRPLQFTPRIMQPTPTQPSSTSCAYWCLLSQAKSPLHAHRIAWPLAEPSPPGPGMTNILSAPRFCGGVRLIATKSGVPQPVCSERCAQ